VMEAGRGDGKTPGHAPHPDEATRTALVCRTTR
jgi:hypothetical protein